MRSHVEREDNDEMADIELLNLKAVEDDWVYSTAPKR